MNAEESETAAELEEKKQDNAEGEEPVVDEVHALAPRRPPMDGKVGGDLDGETLLDLVRRERDHRQQPWETRLGDRDLDEKDEAKLREEPINPQRAEELRRWVTQRRQREYEMELRLSTTESSALLYYFRAHQLTSTHVLDLRNRWRERYEADPSYRREMLLGPRALEVQVDDIGQVIGLEEPWFSRVAATIASYDRYIGDPINPAPRGLTEMANIAMEALSDCLIETRRVTIIIDRLAGHPRRSSRYYRKWIQLALNKFKAERRLLRLNRHALQAMANQLQEWLTESVFGGDEWQIQHIRDSLPPHMERTRPPPHMAQELNPIDWEGLESENEEKIFRRVTLRVHRRFPISGLLWIFKSADSGIYRRVNRTPIRDPRNPNFIHTRPWYYQGHPSESPWVDARRAEPRWSAPCEPESLNQRQRISWPWVMIARINSNEIEDGWAPATNDGFGYEYEYELARTSFGLPHTNITEVARGLTSLRSFWRHWMGVVEARPARPPPWRLSSYEDEDSSGDSEDEGDSGHSAGEGDEEISDEEDQ
jgi:hypothetical protein